MNVTDSTVYIVGHSKTNTDNAITDHFKLFFIGFIVNVETDRVEDLECSVTLSITSRFIQSIFVGQKFDRVSENIENQILTRYFGSSQKAILVAYKDAVKKYRAVKTKHYPPVDILKNKCH